MGAKESPRFGSGTLWGKEVWEGEWPGPGEAEEGGLGMVPKMISEPPTFILLPTPALTGIQM